MTTSTVASLKFILMDLYYHLTLFWACKYLYMLEVKLIYVNKWGHWRQTSQRACLVMAIGNIKMNTELMGSKKFISHIKL